MEMSLNNSGNNIIRKKVNVSLMPSFYCSAGCGYCYLGSLNKDNACLPISKIDDIVKDIEKYYDLWHIDIYGGELGELPEQYLKDCVNKILAHTQDLSLMTNLKNDRVIRTVYDINKEKNLSIPIGISINLERGFKPNFPKIKSKYLNLSIVQVVLPSLLSLKPKTILDFIKRNYNRNVLFLQYYPSQIARVKYHITNKQFSEFMISILDYYTKHKDRYDFSVMNLNILEDRYNNNYNPQMDAHIFISPQGKYGCIKYDEKGLEYFAFYDTIEEWISQCKEEQNFYLQKCGLCPYFRTCVAEHIQNWAEDDTCCGHPKLIEWYENYKRSV